MINTEWLLILCCLALIIDQLFGEYPNAIHPVVWMGKAIEWGQNLFLGRGQHIEFWGAGLS